METRPMSRKLRDLLNSKFLLNCCSEEERKEKKQREIDAVYIDVSRYPQYNVLYNRVVRA
jgi:hypothetical protein